ncbi:MAG TPA: hypothetical protein VJP76_07400 [Candidatus Tumulicola sp.]|nr:hypothetical protein [Candidatus Tumulicola sp.]
MPRFLLGINYWPRRSAMYAWERFDLGEVREDAARIAGLGFDVVRFFLSWNAFAPEPERVDRTALRHLERMAEAFGEAGLQLMPTLFCGHMSGVNWLPPWSLDPGTPHGRFRTIAGGAESPYGIGDFYADPLLLRAQVALAREAAVALRGHPALLAWDIGNEFSNLREPKSPHDAADWSLRLSETLRDASGAGVTGGMHAEDLERDRHLRPSSIARPWAFASMHGYSVYSTFSRGRLDVEVVPFLAQLQASCSAKPVLFTELGNPTCPPGTVSPYDREPLPGAPAPPPPHARNAAAFACLSEEEMAGYARATIDRLHARGALGAFWWCWADYDPALATLPPFDRAPHELTFGIVRADGSLKPVARTLAQIAGERRETVAPPSPIAGEAAYYTGLPADLPELYRGYCESHG